MRTTTRAERGERHPAGRSPATPRRARPRACARVGTGARGSRVRAGACIVAAAQPRSRTADGGGAPLPTPHSRVACRALRPRCRSADVTARALLSTGTGDTSHRRDTAAGAVTPLTTSGDLAPELDLRWRYAIHTRTAESPKEIVRRPVHGRLACGAWAGGSA